MLLLLALLGTAACSDDKTDVAAGDSATTTEVTAADVGGSTTTEVTAAAPTSTGAPTTAAPPTSAPPKTDAPMVLQVSTGAGYAPVDAVFRITPEFTLYRDGLVVVTGPTTLEFPGPALPNLLAGTLDPAGVNRAVDAATRAGVGQAQDFGPVMIADLPTTTFVLVKDGRRTETGVYGLRDSGGGSSAQQESRRRFAALADQLQQLGNVAAEPYAAKTVSVLVSPYPVTQPGQPAIEPAPGVADWPLADLATGGVEQYGGRCVGFTGADATKVLTAAGRARSNTRWRSAGRDWSLSFRPELPGTAACAGT